MGLCLKLFGVITIILIAVLYQGYVNISKPYPRPNLDLNEYWGPGNKAAYKEDVAIVSNRIHYPDEVINDLKKELNKTWNYHEPLEGVGFEYGFNSRRLKQVIDYWRDDYLPRWRERESYLWGLPQLTTQIQGLRIHFIQTKAREEVKKAKKVFPVLLLHGWPGSVREFYEIIQKLADTKNDYVFEVVAPSLPGYGWSQGSSKTNFGPAQIAVVLRNLMIRLGYDKFFIQGGDWGSIIGSNIATLFPDNVIGYHSNMCYANTPLSNIKMFIASLYPSAYIAKENEEFYYPMTDKWSYLIEEAGYFFLQATKPDTIGTALTNNPIGLAAYILEKFSTWTDKSYRKLKDGGFERNFKIDTLLDNVMIYYLTNSITTSQRLYSEAFSTKQRALMIDRVPTDTPTGCARFKHDLAHTFDWQLEEKYPNLIHSSYFKNGGHFIAMELPNVLYQDFVTFVEKVITFKAKSVENKKKTVK